MLLKRGVLAALLAGAVVSVGELAGWHGVDTAASVYRVNAYRSHGFQLWDFAWYGGHWTLGYSVIYPPLASAVGIGLLAVVSAAMAAAFFDCLARAHLGRGGAAASYLFALGTLVQSAIGQYPFLTGEAFALAALWALSVLSARYQLTALVLAAACTLSSPLTGAFLALCVAAWLIGPWIGGVHPSRGRLVLGASTIVVAIFPVIAGVVLFPGDGPMPYPVLDWAWETVIASIIALLAGRRYPAVTAGAAMWAIVACASVTIPSALGGNVGRIEDVAALPFAVALASGSLRLSGRTLSRRLLGVAAAIPLALSEWLPAVGAITVAPALASTQRAFYLPLDAELASLTRNAPASRVEVVPTEYHWEAAYVAPAMPLARGWERQLDTAYNPIFYNSAPLTPSSYRSWLQDNGVTFVALPHAPLDFAGTAEANLVSSGKVPGLTVVWATPQWSLYKVAGATGIVAGPARLVRTSTDKMSLDVTGNGSVETRVRYSPDWVVSTGSGCIAKANGSWMTLERAKPGLVALTLSLLHPGSSSCR